MSKQINDGGPAFAALAVAPSDDAYHQQGMSLRDWYAGQALASGACDSVASEDQLKKWFGDRYGITGQEIIAFKAYAIADAMLSAREQKDGE